jgi:hypothetical protein
MVVDVDGPRFHASRNSPRRDDLHLPRIHIPSGHDLGHWDHPALITNVL